MNRERILKVADFLEALPPERFDPDFWFKYQGPSIPNERTYVRDHPCGTAACIGGWTEILFDPEGNGDAEDLLGLTTEQADALFFDIVEHDPSPAQAAAVLRRLAETGEVVW